MTIVGWNVGPRTPSGTGTDCGQDGGRYVASVPAATTQGVASSWHERHPGDLADGVAKRNARRAGGRFAIQVPGHPGKWLLDRAAPGARAPGDHPDHEDRDDRADRRNDDRADVEGAVDRMAVEQDAGEETADESADDAEHDVPDDAESFVTCDEKAGEIPGDGAEDDPRDDAHSVPPSPSRASHPTAGVNDPVFGTGHECRGGRDAYRQRQAVGA